MEEKLAYVSPVLSVVTVEESDIITLSLGKDNDYTINDPSFWG